VRVAAKLNREWASRQTCRVHALLDYYRSAQNGYVDALKARGFDMDEIGTHAGLADTALSLAIDPALVRAQALEHAPKPGVRDGVHGDPRRATAELGQLGVDLIVDASVAKIRELVRVHPGRAAPKESNR
jgi:creatinine amidohydrolase/Fe(II)-dependent formamide hydrolase-like protein